MKSPCLKCAIAEGEISIAPNGDVYPCQLLHNPEFLCGNIRSTPIAQIYADSAAAKRCRALTVDNLDKCNRCAIKYSAMPPHTPHSTLFLLDLYSLFSMVGLLFLYRLDGNGLFVPLCSMFLFYRRAAGFDRHFFRRNVSFFQHSHCPPSMKSRRYWEGVIPSDFLNTLVNTR